MKRLLYLILAIILAIPFSPSTIEAADPTSLKVGDKIPVAVNGEVELISINKDKTMDWKVTYSGPKYTKDLSQEIDPSWYYNDKDKVWETGPNLFSSSVSGETITVTYEGEELSWTPIIYIDGKKVEAFIPTASAMGYDPINENYYRNTLKWNYFEVERRVRVIEGLLMEFFILEEAPKGDIVIDFKKSQSKDFTFIRDYSVYDANGTPVKFSLLGDSLEVQLKDLEKVTYPITIDPDVSFTTSASDGYVYTGGYWVPYATAWGASNADYLNVSSSTFTVGQEYTHTGGSYWWHTIYRSFLFFDTSSIPDAAVIDAAYLGLYQYNSDVDSAFDVVIQNGMPTYPHEPLQLSDYNKAYYSSDGGSAAYGFFSGVGYKEITLNATGEGWIDVDGTTKLCLRSSRDISGTAPEADGYYGGSGSFYDVDEWISFWSYEKGVGYWPYLEVSYTAESAPVIDILEASRVSATTARLNGYIDYDGGDDVEIRWGYGDETQAEVDFEDYDTVTDWSGDYISGDNILLDIDTLALDTEYFYRFQARNSFGTTTSDEKSFTTLDAIADPSNLVATPSSTSISLSWVKGLGSTGSILRMKTTGYPVDETDGTLIYEGVNSTAKATGLTVGTTYYFSVWAYSGANISADSADDMTTTLAYSSSGTYLEDPETPSGWFASPDYTNLELFPLYEGINEFSDSFGMPRGSMWLLIVLFAAAITGLIVFFLSRSLIVAILVSSVFIVGGWAASLLPLWMLALYLIMSLGLTLGVRQS